MWGRRWRWRRGPNRVELELQVLGPDGAADPEAAAAADGGVHNAGDGPHRETHGAPAAGVPCRRPARCGPRGARRRMAVVAAAAVFADAAIWRERIRKEADAQLSRVLLNSRAGNTHILR